MSPDRNGPQSGKSTRTPSVPRADLPQAAAPAPRAERADAVRNRALVLRAAQRLFAERGVDAVTMDEVAAAAGVGKGTIFRRFGDKAGLAVALLDDREKELQAIILGGPAPLGPGAAPSERLAAFVEAYLRYAEDVLDVLRMSETAAPGRRHEIGAYRFWHAHLAQLARQQHTGIDPGYLADVVLALLSADLLHQQRSRGLSWQEIRTAAARAAACLLAG